MGVQIGDADGDHVVLAKCGRCGTRYETDETMGNDCPDCGVAHPDVLDGAATNPELSWRDDSEDDDSEVSE